MLAGEAQAQAQEAQALLNLEEALLAGLSDCTALQLIRKLQKNLKLEKKCLYVYFVLFPKKG